MSIYFDFPSSWWIFIGLIYLIYLLTLLVRKKPMKMEMEHQLLFAFITLLFACLIEFVGVSLGLWNYNPGNWPWPLVLAYFGVGLAGFQIVRKLDE